MSRVIILTVNFIVVDLLKLILITSSIMLFTMKGYNNNRMTIMLNKVEKLQLIIILELNGTKNQRFFQNHDF